MYLCIKAPFGLAFAFHPSAFLVLFIYLYIFKKGLGPLALFMGHEQCKQANEQCFLV